MGTGGKEMNREELLKIAKPILFNTEMTQATLENRKTVTRRNPFKFEMKDGYNPDWSGYSLGEYFTGNIETGVCLYSRGAHDVWGVRSNVVKPKYKVGDILYVQETWQIHDLSPEFCMMIRFKADNHCELQVEFKPSRFDKFEKFYYKNGWQSPYFMPKEAARLFLKVTNVRVERLQDITSEQAKNEGVDLNSGTPFPKATARDCHGAKDGLSMYQSKFVILWDSTIKKQDLYRYGWKANPWVWVIEFERVEVQS